MSAVVDNLARCVIESPAFATASAGELGETAIPSSEIAASAQKIAFELRAMGVAANEPVIIFIANRPEDVIGFLGFWLAGCVAVPIHVATPESAVQSLLMRLGARIAVRAGQIERIGTELPPIRPLLAGAALVVFTSGSTGRPKGVVLSHKGLVWKLQALARLLQPSADDVVVVPLQLTFIFGIWVSLLSLMSGARLVLAPDSRPRR